MKKLLIIPFLFVNLLLIVHKPVMANNSCAVGVIGTSASITFHGNQGISPNMQCQGLQSFNNGKLIRFHVLAYIPKGNMLCQGKMGKLLFVVRDTGNTGKTLCLWLSIYE